MFDKILIANRGEITVRIIHTCRRLGIRSVAVYSDADSRSLHVQMADESVRIGTPPAQMSYLDADKILSAALATGCRAVHPGYGFLSENSAFAGRVADAGLVFIGPPADVIDTMGDKIASKALAVKAGVPIIPGHAEALTDEEEALAAADGIGYPVLLKPAAGGGGKGMRIVRRPEEMKAALAASRQETRKAFGDSRIFMERYIEGPRHVEIQILADIFGNVVHLGERECSIQRRYQKIIEESPSPAVSEALRQRMGRAACDLARKAGYVNAGTVEFVLDARGEFFFLEMNTRLQVEHPVTEMVTGLDLVDLQLRIARGQKLPFDQEGVTVSGWAMEARVCAEDPERGFIPSTGMITRYAEPRGNAVRVDSGVQTGSSIGVYYDSMLAKVICHGKDREEARVRLVEALNGYHIEGVVTNIDFANSILCHPEFARGNLTTGFIERYFEGSQPAIPSDRRAFELAALTAALIYHVRTAAVRDSLRPMASRIGGRKAVVTAHRYTVRSGDEVLDLRLEGATSGRYWTIRVNENAYSVKTPEFEFYRRRLNLTIDGRLHRFRLRLEEFFIFVAFSGITRVFEIYTPREWALVKYMPKRAEHPADNVLLCPMPGLVVGVPVQPGERVFRGQTLVVLESMKMESDVASPVDGLIEEVCGTVGQAVEAGDVLIRFQA
ncbi:acetyl-CoA carboxylase biotin carboxylase subunit [Desulfococcus sp.]|uniref:acetyl-CoA carboxylase biotin carboxylase subunit n=1 Tax=Desulfococcus sp. TaxID=2025834 RepID=UPI0035934014